MPQQTAKIIVFRKPNLRQAALITENLDLVRKIAVHMARSLPPCFDVDDLIGAGNVALIGIAKRYKPLMNENFAAYAKFRIRGAMLDSVKRRRWLEATMEPIPNPEEKEIRGSGKLAAVPMVLPKFEAEMDRTGLEEKLWRLVSYLRDDQGRAIVEMRYRDNLTAAQIGGLLGINASRVSRLYAEALLELRQLAVMYDLRAA